MTRYGREVDNWCVADELTRSHAKVGRAKDEHVTPFGLLRWIEHGDEHAAALFREYAAAFCGRRALFWSPRLKARLKISDLTESKIMAELGKRQPVSHERLCAEISGYRTSGPVSR